MEKIKFLCGILIVVTLFSSCAHSVYPFEQLSNNYNLRMNSEEDLSIKSKVNIYFNEKELSEELIKQQDLFFLSNDQLRLLRNAFYAIHGYDFKSQDLKEYFSGFSWYKPNPNFSESDFTEIERKNIELIRQMENQEETIILRER